MILISDQLHSGTVRDRPGVYAECRNKGGREEQDEGHPESPEEGRLLREGKIRRNRWRIELEQDQESQNQIALEKQDRMNTEEELCGPSFLNVCSSHYSAAV